jgi:hypothetical protein
MMEERMTKQQEPVPLKEVIDGEVVYHQNTDELNDDWIRSSRLDPNSEEFKAREKAKMIRKEKP